jgi:hypothetical protein
VQEVRRVRYFEEGVEAGPGLCSRRNRYQREHFGKRRDGVKLGTADTWPQGICRIGIQSSEKYTENDFKEKKEEGGINSFIQVVNT